MGLDPAFWSGRKVLLTGHSGFKGAWAALWLRELGARVTGYALAPPTVPNLFELARVEDSLTSVFSDIRDLTALRRVMAEAQPEIVIHMAAQSLVRRSYRNPIETYEVNALGTAYLLESIRTCQSVRVAVIVTSDKCYENRESLAPYRESEPLGGHDPYASSKACAELIAAAYRSSFFCAPGATQVATARAGNVIGGGDWAEDRLIPDIARAVLAGRPIEIRNPEAVRPWQHVLDPIAGYFLLAERLWGRMPKSAGPWNFGPDEDAMKPVSWIVDHVLSRWGGGTGWEHHREDQLHEATLLLLHSSKAREQLGWQPKLDLEAALNWTVDWYRAYGNGADPCRTTIDQIRRYSSLLRTVSA